MYPFTLHDVHPLAQDSSARIRINGGSWITGMTKSVTGGKTNLIGFSSSVSNGASYEYQLFNSSGTMIQWVVGTVGSNGSEQAKYTYDRNFTREHIIDSDSDFDHTRQILEQSSGAQTIYTQRLLHSIATGASVDNVIHRSQEYNAFGEIITEIDGRGNQTDLRYDGRGNLVQKISPETDAWSEALAAQWASNPNKYLLDANERIRPTENYFYDALGNNIGSEDANGNRNTRLMENGRVSTEYYADSGIKTYSYDRLGNLRLEVDQINRAVTREYDDSNRLTQIERHVGAEANNILVAGISFDRWKNTENVGNGEVPDYQIRNNLKISIPRMVSSDSVTVRVVNASNHSTIYGEWSIKPGSSRTVSTDFTHSNTYVYVYQDGQLVHQGAMTLSANQTSVMNMPANLVFTNVDSYIDRIGYDARGNRIWHENAHGNRESYLYDAEGRITQYTSAAGRVTQYDYQYLSTLGDGVLGSGAAVGGTQTTVTNANGDTLIDRHTHFGKLVYHQDMGGHDFDYRYNAAGWLYEQTGTTANAQGNVTGNDQHINYYYYDNGYLKEVVDTGYDRYALFQYDENGNRVNEYYAEAPFGSGLQTKVPYQVATAEYDELNRVKRVYETDRYDIRYFYDANGNRRRVNSQYTDLLRDQQQVQDFYYRYDSMNRFVVTLGEINGSGVITHGNTGYSITYNAAGERFTAESNLPNGSCNPDYNMERYHYDAIGTLNRVELKTTPGGSFADRAVRINNALGQISQYIEYDSGGGVTRSENYVYDDDHKLLRSIDDANVNERTKTSYGYLADGTLSHSYTRTLDASGNVDDDFSRVWQTYNYAKWDSYKESSVTVSGDLSGYDWEAGQSSYQFDANGHVREFYDHAEDRTIRYVNNHQGQVMKRYQVDVEDGVQADPIIRRFFYLNGIGIGDQGTDEVPSRVDYAQVLADRTDKDGGRLHNDIGDRVSAVTSADFDQNFRPIGPDYPAKTPGTYVVNSGDTLQSVAAAVWGDSSLWYLIADANGLSATQELAAGTRLSIPNVVTNIHNNSDTFRPYDPNITLGDTSATLPEPVAKKDDCASLKMIVVMVVTIVVAYYVGVYAKAAFGQIYGAMVGAAAGSIAGQATGIALGVQEDFSWSQVAVSALSAGVAQSIGGVESLQGNSFSNGFIRAGIQNFAAQGLNVTLGQQEEFSWQSFGVAALAGGINAELDNVDALTGTGQAAGTLGETLGQNFVHEMRMGLVRGAINNQVFDEDDDEYMTFRSVATTALGNAIGNSLVGQAKYNELKPEIQAIPISDRVPYLSFRDQVERSRGQGGALDPSQVEDYKNQIRDRFGKLVVADAGSDLSDSYRTLQNNLTVLEGLVDYVAGFETGQDILEILESGIGYLPSSKQRELGIATGVLDRIATDATDLATVGAKTYLYIQETKMDLAAWVLNEVGIGESVFGERAARFDQKVSDIEAIYDNRGKIVSEIGKGIFDSLVVENIERSNLAADYEARGEYFKSGHQIGLVATSILSTLAGVGGAAKALAKVGVSTSKAFAKSVDDIVVPNPSVVRALVGKNSVQWKVDADGRPIEASGTLREYFKGAKRGSAEVKEQRLAGQRGLADDHGGHLVGHRFVRDQGAKNLFPQNSNFNNSAFKKLENDYARFIDNGDSVEFRHVLGDFNAATGRHDTLYVNYKVYDSSGDFVEQYSNKFKNQYGQSYQSQVQ